MFKRFSIDFNENLPALGEKQEDPDTHITTEQQNCLQVLIYSALKVFILILRAHLQLCNGHALLINAYYYFHYTF